MNSHSRSVCSSPLGSLTALSSNRPPASISTFPSVANPSPALNGSPLFNPSAISATGATTESRLPATASSTCFDRSMTEMMSKADSWTADSGAEANGAFVELVVSRAPGPESWWAGKVDSRASTCSGDSNEAGAEVESSASIWSENDESSSEETATVEVEVEV